MNNEILVYVDFLSRLINQQATLDEEIIVATINLECKIRQLIDSNLHTFPISYELLRSTYSDDSKMQTLSEFISSNWNNFSKSDSIDFQLFFNRRDALSISNDIILFGERVVIPDTLRSKILHQLHKDHPGIVYMKSFARLYVYWPKIDKEIEQLVNCCSKCAIAGKSPTKSLLYSWPKPSKPWERIHIDFAGPYKGSHFLVLIDAYSKWPEIIKTSSMTTRQTIKLLPQIFSRFVNPEQLISDNGTNFTSEKFKIFCDSRGMKHIRTSPYTPMSNGQAELNVLWTHSSDTYSKCKMTTTLTRISKYFCLTTEQFRIEIAHQIYHLLKY